MPWEEDHDGNTKTLSRSVEKGVASMAVSCRSKVQRVPRTGQQKELLGVSGIKGRRRAGSLELQTRQLECVTVKRLKHPVKTGHRLMISEQLYLQHRWMYKSCHR